MSHNPKIGRNEERILPKPLREANLGKKLSAIIWRLRDVGRGEIADAIERDMRVLLNYAEQEKPFEEIWSDVKSSLESGTFLTPLPEDVKKIIDLEASGVDISEDLQKYSVDVDELEAKLREYFAGGLEIEDKLMSNVPDLQEENPDLFALIVDGVIPVDTAIDLWKKYKDKMKNIKTIDDLYHFLWEVGKANIIRNEFVMNKLKEEYPTIASTLEALKLIVVGVDLKNTDYLIVYVYDFERLRRIPVVFPLKPNLVLFMKLISIKVKNAVGESIRVNTLMDVLKEEIKSEGEFRKIVKEIVLPTPPTPYPTNKEMLEVAKKILDKIGEVVELIKEQGINMDVVLTWGEIIPLINQLYNLIFSKRGDLKTRKQRALKGAYLRAWEYFVEKCYEEGFNPYKYIKEFDDFIMVLPENVVEKDYKKILDEMVLPWIRGTELFSKEPALQFEMDNSPRVGFRRYRSVYWLKRAIEVCEIRAKIVKGAIEKGYRLDHIKKYLDELARKVSEVKDALPELLGEHAERVFRKVEKKEVELGEELKRIVEEELERYKKYLRGEEGGGE